jgi:type VI secretion system FHA domain protein
LLVVITLTVVAFNDTPADGTLKVHFDELGGSIGRAENNQLVLPDPERMVSRVAAQVVYRNGAFAIIDRGSNPIMLNGQALSSGREAPLASGDRVRICGYELSVELGAGGANAAVDPFSRLLGPAMETPSPRSRPVDPLAQPGRGARPPAPAAPAAGGIPVDWDPFAPPSSGVARGAASLPARDAFGLDTGSAPPAALVSAGDLPSAAPSSLDQLFGLGPSVGGDPLGASVLDAPLAQPNMAADADPLRSLNSAPKASAASEADQLSDLQRPFIPPTTIKPATPAGSPAPRSSGATWNEGRGASGPVGRRDAPPAMAVPARAAEMVQMPSPIAAVPGLAREDVPAHDPAVFGSPTHASAVHHPTARAPTAHAAAAHAAPPSPVAGSADGAALLEAFRRGLNAPALEMPALTPELMELIGELLHEAVRGTVDLLRARTTVKHELRAEITTIVAKNNNPLKFSPNVEVALEHLLAPPARGFIAAAPAMRDAYDDLRTHQFAFVAGMQAVLEAALQRFDPASLEARLGARSLLHGLLPASRHARLWEMFTEHYARIRSEAADDFHALFGHAFLAAYDEHVKRLQDPGGADRPEA